MALANEVIKDALALVLVDEADISFTANELNLGARFLNDLNAEFEALGIFSNFTPVNSPDDPITSPASALSGLKFSLAPRMAPLFGVNYVPTQEARAAISSFKAIFMKKPLAGFGSTMPRGSGNRRFFTGERDFYPAPLVAASLSSQVSQTITIAAIDTPVLIGSTWNVDRTARMTGSTAGRLTLDAAAHLAMIEANFTIQSNTDNLTFYVYKNGAQLAPGVPVTADQVRNVYMQRAEPMVTGDFIEIFVENNQTTADVVIDQRTLRII